MAEHLSMDKPVGIMCESGRTTALGRIACRRPAAFVYGPECESETGKLMYLCDEHAQYIKDWSAKHPNDPVTCPEHGVIGPVKSYLVLSALG